MSKNIKGITIELNGDTTGLTQALKKVDSETKKVQTELKQVGSLLKLDPSNTELLAQKQQLLGKAIESTATRLDALKQAQSEVERQFKNGEIGEEAFRKFQREIIATEGKLQAFKKQAENTKIKIDAQADLSGLDKMKDKLQELSDTASETSQSIGDSLSTGVSTGIAAMGVGAGMIAAQFDDANASIQASLGVTKEEAEALGESVKEVWKDGFGESLDDVSNALLQVKQNMRDLDDGELENVTKSALALSKTFDSDVNEVTRAANNLMKNFGIDSETAFDMMAKAAQNGLNFSNEMFDNLAEYAPLWADMGYSAEEMFGILQAGTEQGVYNLDFLNDVMKEFQIITLEAGDGVAGAMKDMNAETQRMWEEFGTGKVTVNDFAKQVAKDLATVEDAQWRNILGAEFFGTKWEDLGGDVVISMLTAGEAMTGFEGTMQSIIETQEQAFGQRWQSFIRTASSALEPLGHILLDIAETLLPKIISVGEKLATWFSDLNPIIQTTIVAIGAIGVVIARLVAIIGALIPAMSSVIGLFTSLGSVTGLLGAAISAITGPIGIAVTAIALIGTALATAYTQSETFRNSVQQVFESVKKVVTDVFTSVASFAKDKISEIKSFWDKNGNQIRQAFETVFHAMKKVVEAVMPVVKSLVEGTIDAMKNVMDGGLDFIMGLVKTFSSLFTGDFKGMLEGIKQLFSGAVEAIWGIVQLGFAGKILKVVKGFGDDAVKFISDMVGKAKGKFDEMVSSASTKFNDLKNKIVTPIKNARDTISGIVNEIKGFFSGLSLKMPDMKLPKLPKFKLTGSFSLNPPSVPKLSVSWNAKGGIFNKPTIFNTANAGLQGVGEAGKEAIIPLKPSVLAGIGKGIAEQMNVGNPMPAQIVVQSVLDGRILAQSITNLISQNQHSKASLKALTKGMSL